MQDTHTNGASNEAVSTPTPAPDDLIGRIALTLPAVLGLCERYVDAIESQALAASRLADATDRQADALARIASTFPQLSDDRQRWMYRLAPTAVSMRPSDPDKVKDPRSRAAILATGLGDSFEYWALDEDARKARNAEREKEREHKALDNAQPFQAGSY